MEEGLREFMLNRGISLFAIANMEENKIDKTVIPAMDDDALAEYIDKQGDRIAVKQFCNTKATQGNERKLELLQSLRRKLNRNSEDKSTYKKIKHLSGNRNAIKTSRKIELGWLHEKKQVRSRNGGGTRKIDVDKSFKRTEIMQLACSFFFPESKSKFGNIEEYNIQICDFSQEPWNTDETVGDMYERTGMNLLRFFLSTTTKDKTESPDLSRSVKINLGNKSNSRTLNDIFSSPTDFTTIEDVPSPLPDLVITQNTDSATTEEASSPLPDPDITENVFNFDSSRVDGGDKVVTVMDYHYKDEDVSFNIPYLDILDNEKPTDSMKPIMSEIQPHSENEDNASDDYTSHANQNEQPANEQSPATQTIGENTLNESVIMTVHRGSLAFHELISYFKDPEIMNKIITVQRILPNGKREMAEDTGGVLKDMLSEFWDNFYDMCTEGRDAKVPALRHDLGLVEWQAIGRILVFGHRCTGYWPLRIAKSFALAIVATEEVSNQILLEDFWNFVSVYDKDILQQACKNFSSVTKEDLEDSLETYECKIKPREENLKTTLLEIAHTQLIQKPNFVINSIRQELMNAKIGKELLDKIYERIKPTHKKMLSILEFPTQMDSCQNSVVKYLKRYIKEMQPDKLGVFLRFCTGSDLLTVDKITVEFNALTGTQRRPTAHTCGSILQLPKTYESFVDFRYEFDNILSSNIWIMDII